MHIAIDLQACQTPDSRQRGIGRYSSELATAIVRARGGHATSFLVNDAYAEHIAELRGEFDAIEAGLTFSNYRLLPLDGLHGAKRRQVQCINDELLNWQYACIGADVLHISSVFEGWLVGKAHVTSRPADIAGPIRSATLYDLIPLLFSDVYLAPEVRPDYMTKIGVFQQLDVVLAISESARQDAIIHLGIAPDRVVNIRGATRGAFRRIDAIDPVYCSEVRTRYGLDGRFMMYTGGIDHRKNIPRLIDAFASLPPALVAQVQLAIVCAVLPDQRDALLKHAAGRGLAPGRLVLTGYIPDADLNLLYNVCEVFVFPSLYEGFGLPLLEAMSCGACVLASNASSMPEIAGRHDVLFDPQDKNAIARMLRELLESPDRRRELAEFNLRRATEFSWDRCARTAIEAFEEAQARREAGRAVRVAAPRPRVALFSPLPDRRSGIADYSAALLPHWSRHFDLELIADGYVPAMDGIAGHYPVIETAEFERRATEFDSVLYHFGNSEFHAPMYESIQAHPGIVVMHDFYLSGLVHWMDSTGRDRGLFERELVAAHGADGRAAREALQRGEIGTHDAIYRFPMSRRVICNSRGLIFHSEFARALLAQTYPDLAEVPARVVPHFAIPDRVSERERAAARATLDLEADDVLVCAFGFLAETKQNHLLLEALSRSPHDANSGLHLAFVGELPEGEYGKAIRSTIARHPLRQRISITGYASAQQYRCYLAACDIAVSLRALSRGETSGALMKNLAAGRATLTSNYATTAELPEGIVLKVPPGDIEALSQGLGRLIDNVALRADLGEAGLRYVETRLHPALIARQYADSIEELLALDQARCARRLVRAIGRRIAARGMEAKLADTSALVIAAGLDRHPASGRWLSRRR